MAEGSRARGQRRGQQRLEDAVKQLQLQDSSDKQATILSEQATTLSEISKMVAVINLKEYMTSRKEESGNGDSASINRNGTSHHSQGEVNYLQADHLGRVRSFPHVDGNYALYVFIPVYIPCSPKKELTQFLKKVMCLVPGLHVVNIDKPLNTLCKDDHKFEQVALGREFHISLGRTVPIRKHQIDSVVNMLRQKLQFQRRYCIDFNKWEVFVNDDRTRTFLSIEVTAGGLAEIRLQIQAVNEVYRLHNLPEFYKDPHPHVSLVWALGDISDYLKTVMEDMKRQNNVEGSQRRIWTSKFNGIKCKIGKKTNKICKF